MSNGTLQHSYRMALSVVERSLRDDSRPLGFLLGAGTSSSVRPGGVPLIPAIAPMTDGIRTELGSKNSTLRVLDSMLIQDGVTVPTLEDWLSRLRALKEIVGADSVRGMSADDISSLEARIVSAVTKQVAVDLPPDGGGFDAISRWAGAFDRKHPLEIFTLNYDLLVEQSFERHRVAYFDGFLGAHRPFLDVRTMEDDALPSRWARLWKMHGSVNWTMEDGNVFRTSGRNASEYTGNLIHPSHLKYDQSRKMPYLAMQDRLRAFLKEPGALLLSTGYSFGDQHINQLIVEGLSGNPSAAVFAFGQVPGSGVARCPLI